MNYVRDVFLRAEVLFIDRVWVYDSLCRVLCCWVVFCFA